MSGAAPAICVGLVAAALAAPAVARQSVLHPGGSIAFETAHTAWVLIVGAAAVFAVVMGVLALALWRRRRKGGREPRPALWLAGAGIAFPTLALAALLGYTHWRSARLAVAPDPAEIVVSVTGHMFWWEVRYSRPDGGMPVVLANELRLPVGRTVALGLNSADVIHSFWVPALAGKVDMVPGRVHTLRVRADAPGRWRGQCAEFCGEQHARMAFDVEALAPVDFDTWLTEQARPAAPALDAEVERGRAIYIAQRCATCHAVRGLVEGAAIGPDLTHVASRRHLGAGTLPMGRAQLAAWVSGVQAHKPGARMPSVVHLDPASLAALAAFLEHLK